MDIDKENEKHNALIKKKDNESRKVNYIFKIILCLIFIVTIYIIIFSLFKNEKISSNDVTTSILLLCFILTMEAVIVIEIWTKVQSKKETINQKNKFRRSKWKIKK